MDEREIVAACSQIRGCFASFAVHSSYSCLADPSDYSVYNSLEAATVPYCPILTQIYSGRRREIDKWSDLIQQSVIPGIDRLTTAIRAHADRSVQEDLYSLLKGPKPPPDRLAAVSRLRPFNLTWRLSPSGGWIWAGRDQCDPPVVKVTREKLQHLQEVIDRVRYVQTAFRPFESEAIRKFEAKLPEPPEFERYRSFVEGMTRGNGCLMERLRWYGLSIETVTFDAICEVFEKNQRMGLRAEEYALPRVISWPGLRYYE
jgi:hypothetical protein